MDAKLVLSKENIFVCDDHRIRIHEMFSRKVMGIFAHEGMEERNEILIENI